MSKVPQSEKKQMLLRLSEEIYNELKEVSEKELRSINAQIEYFILKGIEDYKKNNS